MEDRPYYHDGMRHLQDRFDSRGLADRLEETRLHDTFKDNEREFIGRCAFFFLATADGEGAPDCSYKGGMPGFLRVVDDRTLAFPNYDGNGMFRSMGNIRVNPQVGLLLIDFERGRRMRINGRATLHEEDSLLDEYPGANLIVRVLAEQVFPNCPRYIHKMELKEHSVYVPTPAHTPPVPEWKGREEFRDVLPGNRKSGKEPDKKAPRP